MVIVIFAATYLFAAVLYTVITALAAGERARAFKGGECVKSNRPPSNRIPNDGLWVLWVAKFNRADDRLNKMRVARLQLRPRRLAHRIPSEECWG
jgi:hypothetical protein